MLWDSTSIVERLETTLSESKRAATLPPPRYLLAEKRVALKTETVFIAGFHSLVSLTTNGNVLFSLNFIETFLTMNSSKLRFVCINFSIIRPDT